MPTIDLRRLRGGAVSWTESVEEPETVWEDFPARFAAPVRLELRAEPLRDGGVHVTGRVATRVALSCRRCLKEVEEPLEVDVDLWFRPDVDPTEEDERVYALEESEALVLDLTPALREELHLAVPTYPTCRPDCPGLCPKCGARRDEEECDCTLDEPDPRWDALRALREG